MSKLKKEWLYGGLIILILAYVGFYLVFDYYDPPGSNILIVFEVNENTAQEGTIIHLTEQDFKEHPVLAEEIKGEKSFERLFRRNGVIPDRKEAEAIRNEFSWNTTTGPRYAEYGGKYYDISVAVK